MEILLVEDDAVDARAVKRMLAADKRFSCQLTEAATAAEAVAVMKTTEFSVILLDLGLPDSTGVDSVRTLAPLANEAAIIVLTGHDSEDFAMEAVSAGAQDYLTKHSINSDMLVRTIRYACERKQAERRLRRSEVFHRATLDAMSSHIAVVNGKGFIVSVNQAWKDFSAANGRDAGNDGSGRLSYLDVCTEATRMKSRDAKRVSEAMTQMLQGDQRDFWMEYPCHAPDRQQWFQMWLTRFGDGNERHIVVAHADITERKLAESMIREQANLLDLAHEGIIGCDIEGVIRFWNRGAERLYGAASQEMIGQSIYAFPGPKSSIRACFDALAEQGEWASELNQQTRDGRELVVDSRWTLANGGEKGVASVIVILADITKRKELEREFLRAQRLESLGTLAGGIAHDLNNVLSPIMTGLSLIETDANPEANQHIIDMMQESVERGARIVKQILAFARGSEDERVTIDVRYLVGRIMDMVRATFPPAIRVQNRLPKGLPCINADATQLDQVILNLLVNARDAMPGGGSITLSGRTVEIDDLDASRWPGATAGEYLAISVEDTGSGIPADMIDKIFDPFFTTKGVGKGTGLGLSTAMGIMRSHQGFITVDSKVGEGTRFVMHLPIAPQTRKADPEAANEPAITGQGERLLVVDDEAPVREMLARTLRRANYQVVEADNGATALAKLAGSEPVDLMIVDLAMPVMGGAATIHAARHLRGDLPILIVSGSVERDMDISNPDLCELPYLSKPCTTPALLKAVHQALHPVLV